MSGFQLKLDTIFVFDPSFADRVDQITGVGADKVKVPNVFKFSGSVWYILRWIC